MPDPAPPRDAWRQPALWGISLLLSAAVLLAANHFQWPLFIPFIGLYRALAWLASGIFCILPVFMLGYLLCRRFLPAGTEDEVWTVLAVSWGAGCAAVMLLGMAALSMGLYSARLGWTVVIGAYLGMLVWTIRQRERPLGTLCRALTDRIRGAGLAGIPLFSWTTLMAMVGVMAAAHAMLPPDVSDELTYHLALPRLWDFQGNWVMPGGNPHLMFPANQEILWGYAMETGGIRAGRFFTLTSALMTLIVLGHYLRTRGYSPWIRDFSLVFILITPMMVTAAPICYVEWPLLFFIVLGWWMSRRFLENGGPASVWIAPLAWAAALGIKYSALPIVGLLSAEWLIRLFLRDRKRCVQAAGALAVAVSLLAAPWYLRNWIQTGDPIFPMGTLEISGVLAGDSGPSSDARSIVSFTPIHGPWRWHAWLYHSLGDLQEDNRLHLLWPLLHVAVLAWGWKRRDSLPWWSVAGGTLVYFSFTPSCRIYFPLLGLVWLFLPEILSRPAESRWFRRWASALLLAMTILSLPFAAHFWFMSRTRAAQDYLWGGLNQEAFLRQEGLITPAVDWIRRNTPHHARIWAWGDDRIFYTDRWTRPTSPYGLPEFMRLVQERGAAELTLQVGKDRIDYILLNLQRCPEDLSRVRWNRSIHAVPPALRGELAGWMETHLQVVFKDDRAVLYRVLPR